MNIDEFIEHTKEKAIEYRCHADFFENDNPMRTACTKSAEDCEWLADCLTKFKDYQQLEEQGRLVKLPCKIGDDVWFVPSYTNYNLNTLNNHSEENKIFHQKVARITFSSNGWYLECDKDLEYATDHILLDKMYKETWFLTQEEAEAKLKELRGGENESNN